MHLRPRLRPRGSRSARPDLGGCVLQVGQAQQAQQAEEFYAAQQAQQPMLHATLSGLAVPQQVGASPPTCS